MSGATRQEVVRFDRSPMNAERWLATLGCGHEVWLTAKQRPKAKSMPCLQCAQATK